MTEFLFLYLACLFSTTAVIYSYGNYTQFNFKINCSFKFGIFVGSLLMAFLKYYELTFVSLLLYFLFYPFLLYRKNAISKKECLLTLLIIWFYCSIFDLLISVIVLYLFKIDQLNSVLLLIVTVIVNLICVLLSETNRVKKFTRRIVQNFCYMNYINVLFVLFFALMFIIGFTILLNTDDLSIEFLLITILILITLVFGLLFSNIIVKYESKLFLKNVKENNEFYIDLNDQSRVFRHNIVSKILAIKSVANEKSMQLIDDLISDIEGKINREVHFKPIPYGLIGIIYQKLADNNLDIDLKVSNEIKDDLFDLLTPRKYNLLIEKLSIMLDNALEACKICDEKVIEIHIYYSDNNIVVKVINTFSSQIDIDQLGTLNYSTKSTKRGLGLFSILRDKSIDTKIEILNNLFVAKLIIKKDANS